MGALAAARRLTEAAPTLHGGGGRSVATAIATGGGRRHVAQAHVDDVYAVSALGAWYAAQRLLEGTALSGVRAWGGVAGDPAEAARATGVRL